MQTDILDYLRALARAVGEDKLEFDPVKISCKSFRLGIVIGWYLARYRVGNIILTGR